MLCTNSHKLEAGTIVDRAVLADAESPMNGSGTTAAVKRPDGVIGR